MTGLTPYAVAFVAGIGALIGGGHGAILAGTAACGLLLVIGLIGAVALAQQQREQEAKIAEAKQKLDDLIGSGGAGWQDDPNLPDLEDIPPQADHPA